ncbi:beta-lactamase/transpeptidase-like protein [Schizophyllum commune Loenen D]|nr:beta-lactamase/transpeptidase-like protein [Schizophyllum commune Loenen D]
MSAQALEQPFRDAIADGKIYGVVMEGRSTSGAVYSRYIGTQTAPDGTTKSLSPDSLPYMASATKLLTTLAALQLVERGKLNLDEDLRPIFPDLTALGVLTAFDADTKQATTVPLGKPLTLRQLLTHSSGMDYAFFNPLRAKYRAANPPPTPAPDQVSRFLMPATHQPGEGWMYGHGPDVAAYLIERASGQRLDAYLREHVFAPVGAPLSDISFFPVREGLGARMPDLNPDDPEGKGLAAVGGFDWTDGGEVCYGGHGAYVTARAYVAVLECILRDDERVLGREMVKEMFRPQLEGKADGALQAALAGPAGPAFGCGTKGEGRNMGLGGLLVGDGDEDLGMGALIWGGGHNTAWFIDPKNGVCGIASPQMRMPTDVPLAMQLKAAFRKNLGPTLREMSKTA